jgi:hypothetical protein
MMLLLRGLFVCILAASLTLRAHSISCRDQLLSSFNASQEVSELVRASGMTLRENPVKPPKSRSTIVYFDRPGCGATSIALPFTFNTDAMTVLSQVNKPDFAVRFIYFDQVRPEQDRAGFFMMWIKQTALSLAGYSRFVPLKIAIALAEPESCSKDDKVNWQLVWDKARFEKAIAQRKAVDGLAVSPPG